MRRAGSVKRLAQQKRQLTSIVYFAHKKLVAIMSRSIPTLTIPPGTPRAFAQKKFPAPGHLTVIFFPAPGHLTTPGIFQMT